MSLELHSHRLGQTLQRNFLDGADGAKGVEGVAHSVAEAKRESANKLNFCADGTRTYPHFILAFSQQVVMCGLRSSDFRQRANDVRLWPSGPPRI